MPQPSKPRRASQDDVNPAEAPTPTPTPLTPAPDADAAAPRATAPAGSEEKSPDTSTLRFAPEQVLAGIMFHVIDEGIARGVCAESVAQAVARLRLRPVPPTIRRSAWLAMTHHDRLEWLLAESRSVPLVREDDMVILSSREK